MSKKKNRRSALEQYVRQARDEGGEPASSARLTGPDQPLDQGVAWPAPAEPPPPSSEPPAPEALPAATLEEVLPPEIDHPSAEAEAALLERQEQLAQQAIDLERWQVQLDEQLRLVQLRQEELERDQRAFRSEKNRFAEAQAEAQKQFATQRRELDQRTVTEQRTIQAERDQLVVELRRLEELRIAAQAQFAEDNRQALQQLTEQRERLEREVAALVELQARQQREGRSALERELAEARRIRREAHDQEQREQQAQLEAAHRARRAALETDLTALRQGAEQERKQLRTALGQELEGLRALVRQELERERLTVQQEQNHQRERQQQELLRDREQHQARLAAERGQLEQERHHWQRLLETRQQELEQREAELAARSRDLSNRQAVLDVDRRELEPKLLLQRQQLEQRFQQEQQHQQRVIEELQEQRDRLEQERQDHEDWRRRFEGREPAEVLRQQRELEQELDRLRAELVRRPDQGLREEVEGLRARRDKLEQETERLRRRTLELEAEQSCWRLGVGQLEQQREQREALEVRNRTLRATVEALELNVNRLEGLYARPAEITKRIASIEQPHFTNRLPPLDPRKAKGQNEPSEQSWLELIHQACLASGLRFPMRLLQAFHTALKCAEWSPLTVLAGVSGTGKSELPRLYSRFGGLFFLPVAVQPNWDSPQDLFGFFNSVDNLFNAQPLLRALIQSQQSRGADVPDSSGLADFLLLVLLDEMNLSHVELYLSDILSKLELRRGSPEPISLEIDIGAGMPRYKVPLGRNVLWVGTMNEDPTTKALSDKVLDRANLLSIPRPTSFHPRQKLELAAAAKSFLPRSSWETWQQRVPLTAAELQPWKQGLERINGFLDQVGRALGHRVWQAVEHYVAVHPTVKAAYAAGSVSGGGNGKNGASAPLAPGVLPPDPTPSVGTPLPSPPSVEGREQPPVADSAAAEPRPVKPQRQDKLRLAFAEALVYKVMPKLRGIETKGSARSRCLDPIRETLGELELQLDADFRQACTGYGFEWKSAHYLGEGEE